MSTEPQLAAAVDAYVARRDRLTVERTARALSDAYRGGASRAAQSPDAVAAYLLARAPATHAAVAAVLAEVAQSRPDWRPGSLLDLGAGPGVATWAALATWPEIAAAELVEIEPEMRAAGAEIAHAGPAALRAARWTASASAAARADLVIASYLLGELTAGEQARFVDDAWGLAADTLVVVEPGTTAGYRRILAVRDAVLGAGGHVVAPCPHARACPLPDGDWCHFGVRLFRSAAHRRAKGGERGFEDEKLSYVALSRVAVQSAEARVLRRPDLRRGHVVLDLCARDGLERRTISKRDGERYRRARKLSWGDAL